MGSATHCLCWSETAPIRQQPLNFPGRCGPLCGMGRCFLRRRVRAAPAAIFLSLPWEMPWRRRSPLYQGEPVFSFEKSAHPGQNGSARALFHPVKSGAPGRTPPLPCLMERIVQMGTRFCVTDDSSHRRWHIGQSRAHLLAECRGGALSLPHASRFPLRRNDNAADSSARVACGTGGKKRARLHGRGISAPLPLPNTDAQGPSVFRRKRSV